VKTVAIVGASSNRAKWGNRSVRAHLQAGYEVFPVNPREKEIEGLKCYKSVLDIPKKLDRVSLYLPPDAGLEVLPEIAKKGCGELFLNPGSESQAIVDLSRKLKVNVVIACSIVALAGERD
jgi:uncharacterized protein